MKKWIIFVTTIILCFAMIIPSSLVYADDLGLNSYIVIDAETGYIMYEHNADIPYAPASITKVMTMYLIFEAIANGQISMDDMVTITDQVRYVQRDGNSQVWLVPGQNWSVRELIKTIAVPSASDAAIAMGEFIAGSEVNFVAMMNNKARELGLTNTFFANPHGLDAPGHQMSARDIAILSQRLIMDFPEVIEFSRMETYTPPSWHLNLNGVPYSLMPSTYQALLRRNRGVVDGLKTGFTRQAGHCMTVTATINGRKTIIVIMGAQGDIHRRDVIEDFIRVQIPTNFQALRVANNNESIENISIPRARETAIPVGTLRDVSVVAPRNNPLVTQVVELNEGVRAPLNEGDEVGTITYFVEEQAVYQVPVYALEDVPAANIFVRILRGIGSIFSGLYNWITNTFF